MVSAVLSGTEERTGHEEERFAHGKGIGRGTPLCVNRHKLL